MNMMTFFAKGEWGQGDRSFILLSVYTEKVVAHAVRREKGTVVLEETATEPQEGPLWRREGTLDVEKVILNAAKALHKISYTRLKGREMVVALAGGVGTFFFTQAKSVRESKDRKISKEEVNALVDKWHGSPKDQARWVFRNMPQQFFIDGFPVPDPVGVNGKELVADVVTIAGETALIRGFEELAAASRVQFSGIVDMRAGAVWRRHVPGEAASTLAILVFETETDIVIMHDGLISGIGAGGIGYGILMEDMMRAFGVGKEEARRIYGTFRMGKTAVPVTAAIKQLIRDTIMKIVEGVAKAAATADVRQLLPARVEVVLANDISELREPLSRPEWLSALPIERNASVEIAPALSPARLPMLDHMALEYLYL